MNISPNVEYYYTLCIFSDYIKYHDLNAKILKLKKYVLYIFNEKHSQMFRDSDIIEHSSSEHSSDCLFVNAWNIISKFVNGTIKNYSAQFRYIFEMRNRTVCRPRAGAKFSLSYCFKYLLLVPFHW